MNVGQIKPTCDSFGGIGNGEWMRDDPSIGGQPYEAEQRSPSETNAFRTGQARVPPATRLS
jgi:hypothetical protein